MPAKNMIDKQSTKTIATNGMVGKAWLQNDYHSADQFDIDYTVQIKLDRSKHTQSQGNLACHRGRKLGNFIENVYMINLYMIWNSKINE